LASLFRIAAGGREENASLVSREPRGVAVVINSELAPDAKLPSLAALRADASAAAQAFRQAGLRVAVDPAGACLAVTKPMHIADDELLTKELPSPLLAAGIMERVTRDQLAAHKKGYVRAELLSEVAQAAAQRLARQLGMLDEKGRTREKDLEDASLSVAVWPSWQVHVAANNGKCIRLNFGLRPPTAPAVAEPTLSGSVLWWAWPHCQAAWGDKRVSVAAGTYALRDLARRLTERGELQVSAQPEVANWRLAVAAEDTPVKTLLWAVSVATGLEVQAAAETARAKILVTSDLSREHSFNVDVNSLAPVRGFGYYSCSDPPIGRELLSRLDGGAAGADWIGWRLSDLPLLYRNWIQEEWRRTHQLLFDKPAPALDPDATFVLWTKCLLVSIGLMREDASGGGYEFLLPAL
jgi:hypothetical protein